MPTSREPTPPTTRRRRAGRGPVRRRVAAATLAGFALALGAVTFAGAPLPQTGSSATTTTSTSATQTTASDVTAATAVEQQPVSSASVTAQSTPAPVSTGTS